jgi:hypothetical protein
LGFKSSVFTIRTERQEIKNSNNKYEGLGLFGVASKDKIKSWWFDSWGPNTVATGTGTTDNQKLTMNSSNQAFSEERTFEPQGDQLIMHSKGSVEQNGKKIPYDQTVIYKRIK